ncbi:hypothetical protein, partial [Escherichia coli]|uniref:hypothetical protein n=1 Tax=Escherichia coli TaxID=562 RepID=UPI002448542A
TRDRLHRETLRSFGRYELTTAYTPAGQLQSQHLNSLQYDRHGRLTEKTDLIPEGVIRTDDERTHRYHYDSQHRLVHYTRTQY